MTPEQFKSLHRGDIIRHRNGDSHVIIDTRYNNIGEPVEHTAIREVHVSMPHEWEVVRQHDWNEVTLSYNVGPDHCIRCGSLYSAHGSCTRWGCQGGIGENPYRARIIA